VVGFGRKLIRCSAEPTVSSVKEDYSKRLPACQKTVKLKKAEKTYEVKPRKQQMKGLHTLGKKNDQQGQRNNGGKTEGKMKESLIKKVHMHLSISRGAPRFKKVAS